MQNYTVKLENDRTITSKVTLSRRGLTLICVNLAGENVYSATDNAWSWVKSNFDCQYLNNNGELVKAA